MKLKKITAGLTAVICCVGMFSVMPYSGVETYAAAAVYNNFETDFEGWHGTNYDVVMEAVTGAGYGGSRGMTVSGRQTAAVGATSAKGLYMFGDVEYTYSMQVYSAADETFNLNMLIIDEKTGEETVVELDSAAVKGGEWTELSAVYTAPKDSYEFRLTLTTDSTNDFAFDEVKITTEETKAVNAVYAASADQGLKDAFANYFRVGNILNGYTVNNSGITGMIIKNYNSLECENETKPDATLVKNGSTNTDIKVTLNGAAAILDFCIKNDIPLRGHALVWHSQTPQWFFKDNFQDGGSWVNSTVMDQRLESYIKNLFALFQSQYPSLNLYAYDVCNEVVSDDSNRTANNGGARVPGYGNGASPWVQVYGSNAFVERAFTFARKYAPEGCSLFYNDYNEYWDHKRDCIYNMCKDLYNKGLLDGVGMQSHINSDVNGFTGVQTYKTAMQKYASIGCEVQVTELDISTENGKFSAQQQADKYKAVFQAAMDVNASGGRVTAVCIWGPNDGNTWIGSENTPLLHDSNNQPKAAYNALMEMIPESDWGDPKNPAGSTPAAPVEPDENGYYFYSPFETGNDSWSARGSATIAQSSAEAYKGSNSLYVSGRTDAWNGAMKSLNARAFKPGEAYSLSADVKYTTGSASDTFYMKLQYEDASGETQYDSIAEASTVKGEWVQLANTNYTIPAGATNMSVYIETAESTVDFYLDEVVGAVAGTKVDGPGAGLSVIKGDVDGSGAITAFDLAAAKKGLAKGFGSKVGELAADVDENGTVEVVDIVQLTKFILGKINKFGVTETPTEQPTTEKPTEQQPTEAPGNSVDPTKYMESVRQTMTNSVPASATATNSYGTLEAITYYSKKAEKNKKANVLLPEGYNTNEKYPVLYVNHGIFGDQNSMLDSSMKIRDMAGNLVKSGEAKKMIIVYTSMFTSKTLDQCTGFTLENTIAYDDFLYDLTESLMPYMESNYSVATGRENTAITGFSMGGREALYIGVSRPDVFGYIGAACPAPGVTPGSDSFMNHPGNMQESEFKIKDSRYNPYVFMITGGTNDGVVGTFPQSYHNILTTNGCDHIWQEIQGGGHDASCIVPHMYNFMRNIFKVN